MRNDNSYDQFDDDAIPIKRRSRSVPQNNNARRPASSPASRLTPVRKPTGAVTRRAPVKGSVRAIPATRRRPDDDNVRVARRAEPEKKKVFGKVFLIYVGVLLIIAAVFLIYVHGLLVDFEASQVENVIASKLKDIKTAAALGRIEDEISLDGIIKDYSPTDAELSDYEKAFSSGELTYKKLRSAVGSETESYRIYLNGFAVGKIEVKTVKEDMVLAIFPVTEWQIVSSEADTFSFEFPSSATLSSNGNVIEGRPSDKEGFVSYTIASLFAGDTVVTDSAGNTAPFNGREQVSFVNYTVKVLSNYRVYSGDRMIDAATATAVPIEDYQYVKEYCPEVPDLATYHLCLIDEEGSKLSVKDLAGNEIEFTENDYVIDASSPKTEPTMPSGMSGDPDPLKMAETWSLIMSDDLGTTWHGFNLITPYLIKDSYFYNVVWKWVTSVDITFMSGHYLENPKFINESVTDYVKFSDNCFACRIKFDKPMHLDNGNDYVDKIDSIFYFVYSDDTPDDNVNNPHWAIVDRK